MIFGPLGAFRILTLPAVALTPPDCIFNSKIDRVLGVGQSDLAHVDSY